MTTEDSVRTTLAELRAKSPRHAELAGILETLLNHGEAKAQGVLPIFGVRRLLHALRQKGLALLHRTGNDNS